MIERVNLEQLDKDISKLIDQLEDKTLDKYELLNVLTKSMHHLQRLVMMGMQSGTRVPKVSTMPINCPYPHCKEPIAVTLSTGGPDHCPECKQVIGVHISKQTSTP